MKKNFPVAALEVLQPFVEEAKEYASPTIDEKYILFLRDNDEFDVSYHYFRVTFEVHQGTYLTEMSPQSVETIISGTYRTSLSEVKNHFEVWLDIMKRYRNTKTIYDNPARSQAQYFYDEFKIMDEGADIDPFHPDQVKLLDEFIENYKINLLNLGQEDNKEVIEEIIKECNDLQGIIYSESKNKVMKTFAKIWGKTVTLANFKKEGRKFINDTLKELREKIIGNLSEFLIGGAGVAAVEVVKHFL